MAERVAEGKVLIGPEKQYVRWRTQNTPYEILGLSEEADLPEVTEAFRKLVKKYHPDVGGDAVQFALVAAAYANLAKGAEFGVPEDISEWHLRVRPDSPRSRDKGALTLCGQEFPPKADLAREDAEYGDWPKCAECIKISNIGMAYRRRTEG